MHDRPGEGPVTRYGSIFDLRGQLYHRAMETWPDVRADEFLSVTGMADIGAGMTVVDVPSGGAYLGRYLEDVELIGLESSHAFAKLAKTRAARVLMYDGASLPMCGACTDRVLSIAGLHHEKEKESLFREMRRLLKPGGKVIVADVAGDSPVRHFLDEFVGRYCETGHSGWYFGDNTRRELSDAGLQVHSDTLLQYCWKAPDRGQLAEFCRTLFGMTLADTAKVQEGIENYLGYRDIRDGAAMNWELRCFVCHSR